MNLTRSATAAAESSKSGNLKKNLHKGVGMMAPREKGREKAADSSRESGGAV